MLSEVNQSEKGRAGLEVELVFNQSTVTGAWATDPMKLLTPRSRGKSVWVYTGSFGGGLLAGDQTRLDLSIRAGARCFVGTQASTKIYRNPCRCPCGHVTVAEVEEDSVLVFAPAPVQPYADSVYTQRQEFHLAPGASLALVDRFTSGRAACGERWAFAHYESRNEVFLRRAGGTPAVAGLGSERVFLDALCLNPADGPLAAMHRTGNFNCFALVLLVGDAVQQAADQAIKTVEAVPVKHRDSLLVSASPLTNGAVIRVAGEEVEAVELELRRHLGDLNLLLGDDPWIRKW